MQSVDRRRLPDTGNNLLQRDEQSPHRVHLLKPFQGRVNFLKILHRQHAVDAPAVAVEFFHRELRLFAFIPNFTNHLLKNILHGHQPRCPAEFVHHNGQAAPLPLHAPKQIQQVHAGRHKRRKLDRLGQVSLGIEQQLASIQHADDRVRRLVKNRQPRELVLARGGDHFIERQVVIDAGHLGARLHHILRRPPVKLDDFQHRITLGPIQHTLLVSPIQQLGIFLVGHIWVGLDLLRNTNLDRQVNQALRHAANRQRDFLKNPNRLGQAQRPSLRRANREGLRQYFTESQDATQEKKAVTDNLPS